MNVLINWVVHILPTYVESHIADILTMSATGKQIFFKGTQWQRTIDYHGPTLASLAAQPKDPIYGDFMWGYGWPSKNFNIWITTADLGIGPAGSLLLAEVIVDPGGDYKIWLGSREGEWPPR